MDSICVSVIVPAYNASSTIGQTLQALIKQNFSKPYEIIVVDDGSRDHTAQVVAEFPTVKYVRQDNAGPASARNHGARLAQGEYLAFTDSDCVPHEDWLSQLMQGFTPPPPPGWRWSASTPGVEVVAGSYGIANPQSRLAKCIHLEILWRHQHLMPDYPNSFGSYNFCAKKEVFDAVGGFKTSYRHASGEDNDLSYKICELKKKDSRFRGNDMVGSGNDMVGHAIYFERKALVDHYHPTQVLKYLKEQFRHGFWRVMMYRDHPSMMAGDGYTYWKDIVEMPMACALSVGILLCVFHVVWFKLWFWFLLVPFLFFEIVSATMITHCIFGGIFYGFIVFFRAVSRFFGFSTGILSFFVRKDKKIF